jgi:hypothetical protein
MEEQYVNQNDFHYYSRQNETFDKDNPEKEIDTDNSRDLQLQDDIVNIILRWKEGEMRPAWGP